LDRDVVDPVAEVDASVEAVDLQVLDRDIVGRDGNAYSRTENALKSVLSTSVSACGSPWRPSDL
jgi:hypothetical protein